MRVGFPISLNRGEVSYTRIRNMASLVLAAAKGVSPQNPEVHRISTLIPQGCRTRRTPVPAKCISSFTAAAELDEP